MAFSTTNGISVINLETHEEKPLVTGRIHTIIVARHSSNLYYTRATKDPLFSTLWRVNLETGENVKLADLRAVPASWHQRR